MSIFIIDSDRIIQNKTIYSTSFNENIKLKLEYQQELSKLIRYDKNIKPQQFYITRNDKIYYYSKYEDNYFIINIDSALLRDLQFEYPGSNLFGLDLSRNVNTKVAYNGRRNIRSY